MRVLAKLGNMALASSPLVELKHHFQIVLQDVYLETRKEHWKKRAFEAERKLKESYIQVKWRYFLADSWFASSEKAKKEGCNTY